MQEKNSDKPILGKDDIFILLQKVFSYKRLLIRNTVAGLLFGVVVALGVCKTWTSTIVLAPEISGESALGGSVSNLASLAGINLASMSSTDAIYPELYPQIIESTPFVVDLFGVEVETIDGEVKTDLFDYLMTKQKMSWWNLPKHYLTKTVNGIMSRFVKSNFKNDDGNVDPFYLTKEQFIVAEEIRSNIVSSTVNKKDQIITLRVTAQDPLVAAMLVDTVRVRLQDAIIDYRTKKSRHDMEYAEKLMIEARQEYMKAQHAYAEFADAHQNTLLTSVSVRQDDLENQMGLAYNVYSQMVQQYNIAKAKLQERMPSFIVIQPSEITIRPSSVSKIVVVAGWGFMLFVLTVGWVLVKDKIKAWKTKLFKGNQHKEIVV
ncbi:MAG: chain-length determining protein [Bacteroidaceae bacterium]|nr:chain-length determining protein [Bacteroidaceae bacterium]